LIGPEVTRGNALKDEEEEKCRGINENECEKNPVPILAGGFSRAVE